MQMGHFKRFLEVDIDREAEFPLEASQIHMPETEHELDEVKKLYSQMRPYPNSNPSSNPSSNIHCNPSSNSHRNPIAATLIAIIAATLIIIIAATRITILAEALASPPIELRVDT